MVWLQDEFGNLHSPQFIGPKVGKIGKSDAFSICVNGRKASNSYPPDVIEAIMEDLKEKAREGARFIDLEDIIHGICSDMNVPMARNLKMNVPTGRQLKLVQESAG